MQNILWVTEEERKWKNGEEGKEKIVHDEKNKKNKKEVEKW